MDNAFSGSHDPGYVVHHVDEDSETFKNMAAEIWAAGIDRPDAHFITRMLLRKGLHLVSRAMDETVGEWTTRVQGWPPTSDLTLETQAAEFNKARAQADKFNANLLDEIKHLRERIGPRGLEVVMIDGAGHYVNEKVKAEIDTLRSALKLLVEECVNPGDGGRYEAGEWPALDRARAALPLSFAESKSK